MDWPLSAQGFLLGGTLTDAKEKLTLCNSVLSKEEDVAIDLLQFGCAMNTAKRLLVKNGSFYKMTDGNEVVAVSTLLRGAIAEVYADSPEAM